MSIPFTPIPLTAPVPVGVADMIATINHLVNEVNVKLADIAASAGGGALTAGVGISIAADVISTNLTAGTGISISGATITNTQSGGGVTFPLYGTPDATIKGLHSLTTAQGGSLFFSGGSGGSSGLGGLVFISGGSTQHYNAGAVIIRGGAVTGEDGVGGGVSLSGGAAVTGSGGQIVMLGGNSSSGPGGGITLGVGNFGGTSPGAIITQGFAFPPAVAVAGAATVNAQAGTVTTEALVAATAYSLVLTNSTINANSTVVVTATNASGGVLPPSLRTMVKGSGTVTLGFAMLALTGTFEIDFSVFN